MKNPILVTGATGFIGSALIKRLLKEGHQVRAFVLPSEKHLANWPNVEIAEGDVTDKASVEKAMQGIGTVFHSAAVVQDFGPKEWFEAVTIDGTQNVLMAAAQQKAKVILISSVTVYGDKIQTHELNEELAWGNPCGLYSNAKQQQEKTAWKIAKETGLELVTVRPSNVWGPGSKLWVDAVVAELRRGTPSLMDGGNFTAGLVHIDNVVEMLMLAASNPAAVGKSYNVADIEGITWKQYFQDLATLTHSPQPKPIPRVLAQILVAIIEPLWKVLPTKSRPPLNYESYNLVGFATRQPVTRAQKDLGYKPVIRYKEGLEQLKSYLQQKYG